MKVRGRTHKYVDTFYFPKCNARFSKMRESDEYTVEACATHELDALPLAVLAPSIVYSPDFFQSMSRDEPNSEIPLC